MCGILLFVQPRLVLPLDYLSLKTATTSWSMLTWGAKPYPVDGKSSQQMIQCQAALCQLYPTYAEGVVVKIYTTSSLNTTSKILPYNLAKESPMTARVAMRTRRNGVDVARTR